MPKAKGEWTPARLEARRRFYEAVGLDPEDRSGLDDHGSRVLRSDAKELARRRYRASGEDLSWPIAQGPSLTEAAMIEVERQQARRGRS